MEKQILTLNPSELVRLATFMAYHDQFDVEKKKPLMGMSYLCFKGGEDVPSKDGTKEWIAAPGNYIMFRCDTNADLCGLWRALMKELKLTAACVDLSTEKEIYCLFRITETPDYSLRGAITEAIDKQSIYSIKPRKPYDASWL